MNHIDLHVWAATEVDFEACALKFNWASTVDGVTVFHSDLRGWDQPGPMVLPDKSSAFDPETGYAENLPGFYYNLRAVHRPAGNGVMSLAETLRTKPTPDKDGNPVKYEDVDKSDPENERPIKLAKRTRMHELIIADGGKEKTTKGFTGDPKAPRHHEIKIKGEVRFRLFDSDDINTPANTFA